MLALVSTEGDRKPVRLVGVAKEEEGVTRADRVHEEHGASCR